MITLSAGGAGPPIGSPASSGHEMWWKSQIARATFCEPEKNFAGRSEERIGKGGETGAGRLPVKNLAAPYEGGRRDAAAGQHYPHDNRKYGGRNSTARFGQG